jgi:hypothetical protein
MMNWKGCGRKWSWLNLMALSRHSPGGTGEKPQDSRSWCQDLKAGPCEYEVGVLTPRPRRSLIGFVKYVVLTQCTTPCIPNPCSRWRRAASFKLRSFFLRGKSPCIHWIGWSAPVWTWWQRETSLPCRDSNTVLMLTIVAYLVSVPTIIIKNVDH